MFGNFREFNRYCAALIHAYWGLCLKLSRTLFVFLAEFFGAPNFFRRAENFIRIFGAPKKNSSCPKNFRHAEKKFVAPKIFSACWKKNWACPKIFCHDEKNSSRWKFSWEFWARRKFFRRDEFLCQKIGHAEKIFVVPKMEGDNFGMPNFCLVPRSGVDSFHFNRWSLPD